MKNNNNIDSYIYIFSLFLCWVFLYYIVYFLKKYNIKIKKNDINPVIINYIYIIFFGFVSAFLVLLGYKYFNNLIQPFIINEHLTYLTTTTIMITISLFYSAYLKEIFEIIYNRKFALNP